MENTLTYQKEDSLIKLEHISSDKEDFIFVYENAMFLGSIPITNLIPDNSNIVVDDISEFTLANCRHNSSFHKILPWVKKTILNHGKNK